MPGHMHIWNEPDRIYFKELSIKQPEPKVVYIREPAAEKVRALEQKVDTLFEEVITHFTKLSQTAPLPPPQQPVAGLYLGRRVEAPEDE